MCHFVILKGLLSKYFKSTHLMAVKMMGILTVLKCLRRQANFFFFFFLGGGGGGGFFSFNPPPPPPPPPFSRLGQREVTALRLCCHCLCRRKCGRVSPRKPLARPSIVMYIKAYERFILCFAWTSGGYFWSQENPSHQKEKNQIQAECWKHVIHFNKQPLRPKFLRSTPVRYNERDGKYLHCFPCFLPHMQAFMTDSAPQFRNSRKSGFGLKNHFYA